MSECDFGRGLPHRKSPPSEPGQVYGALQGGWVWNGREWFVWDLRWLFKDCKDRGGSESD